MKERKLCYPDFQRISGQEFYEDILKEIENYREEIAEIKRIPLDKATFQNTSVVLERAGEGLTLKSALFFNILHANANAELMTLSEQIVPILSALENEIGMDLTLGKLVQEVFHQQNNALSEIDKRLLKRQYEGYKDRGVFLSEEKRERLKELRSELSVKTLTFGQNVLKEQNEYELQVTDMEALARLPQSALHVARQRALDSGREGWLFDFSAPSYNAIMKYCSDRSLREQLFRDRARLAADPSKPTCNIPLVSEIARLRQQIAHTLEYDTYAELLLKKRMAKSVSSVYDMLDRLRQSYLPLAQEELRKVSDHAQSHYGAVLPLMPWDWSYYVELYKSDTLQYDEEEMRLYFELSHVVQELFRLVERLYGITFRRSESYPPAYHPDVKVYEVRDGGSEGVLRGLLLMDFFPRKGKQSGAWMTSYVEADAGTLPVVSLVMNFTPPTDDTPSLLTFDEVNTLFHEFGHGLHGLLTTVPYSSLSGTNVVQDFVELPSQIMENWLRTRPFMRALTSHYLTGRPMPEPLIDAIMQNAFFLEGYACIRQLGFGYLDMAWHTLPEGERPDGRSAEALARFEQQIAEPLRLLPTVPDSYTSTAFLHIFQGGYASGYYGYKWAEILDADAFELFCERGIYDRETADRFRTEILERGDADDAEVLYLNFRGRPADPDALIRRAEVLSRVK